MNLLSTPHPTIKVGMRSSRATLAKFAEMESRLAERQLLRDPQSEEELVKLVGQRGNFLMSARTGDSQLGYIIYNPYLPEYLELIRFAVDPDLAPDLQREVAGELIKKALFKTQSHHRKFLRIHIEDEQYEMLHAFREALEQLGLDNLPPANPNIKMHPITERRHSDEPGTYMIPSVTLDYRIPPAALQER